MSLQSIRHSANSSTTERDQDIMSDGVFGGSGANGTVSVQGADNQPSIQLLSLPTECVIGAGQTTRAARLTMYDANQSNTINVTAANATVVVGGGNVAGTVSVRGADNQPSVEMLSLAAESVLGIGQQKRPGRISLYNASAQEVVSVVTADGGDILLEGQSTAGRLVALEAEVNVLRNQVQSLLVAYQAHITAYQAHTHDFYWTGIEVVPGTQDKLYGFMCGNTGELGLKLLTVKPPNTTSAA
jgi:hypothetical protein